MLVDDESDETASVDTRCTQRRKTQRVVANGAGHPVEDDGSQEGPGAASSSQNGAPIPSTLAVYETSQLQNTAGALVPDLTHLGMGQGAAVQPFGVIPNGIPDLTTTHLIGHSVTGLPGTASNLLYPQTLGSPVTELQ